MGSFVNIIFFAISFITLAISGGFATNSAVRITGIKGWEKNDELAEAHRLLSIAAIVTWITVAVIIALAIIIIFFIGPAAGRFASIIIYGFLFLSVAAVVGIAILSAIASQKINNSGIEDDNLARRQAIIAAVLASVSGVGIIILFIVRLFGGKKDEEDETEAEVEAEAEVEEDDETETEAEEDDETEIEEKDKTIARLKKRLRQLEG